MTHGRDEEIRNKCQLVDEELVRKRISAAQAAYQRPRIEGVFVHWEPEPSPPSHLFDLLSDRSA